MDLRHVLITRFNLATPGREAPFRNQPGWLDRRFDLFERYCLPTVAAQDEQGFDWIVYFDDRTPNAARERIARCRAVRDFHPFYTPLFDGDGWRRSLRATIGPERAGAVLITSNLDNDDGLASDYIRRVQAAATASFVGERLAVNVAHGFVLAETALYRHHHSRNAFTNMVEPDDEAVRTTMSINHMALHHHLHVVQDNGPGGWLQVIHDGNVSNRVRGRRVGCEEALLRFPAAIVGDVQDPGAWEQFIDRWVSGPVRSIRDLALAAARRLVRVDQAR